uniref:Cell envelope-related transcriptional attenuator domain-containing protein n=1 Tax=candidate division WOR-3 bacterium TaxID=2052148 RepID=A0A7C3Z3X7_UNCW3
MRRLLLLISLSLCLLLLAFYLFRSLSPFRLTPAKRTLPYQGDLGEVFNILVIAHDARMIKRELPNGKVVNLLEERSRSDIIDIIHINLNKGLVNMVNIPRDMLISIPGYTRAESDTDFCNLDKINHSYFFGKEKLLKEVILKNFKVPIHRYLTLNLYSFQEAFSFLFPYLKDITLRDRTIKSAEEARKLLRSRKIWRHDDIDRGRNSLIFIKEVWENLWPVAKNEMIREEIARNVMKVIRNDTDLTLDDINYIIENLAQRNFNPKEIGLSTLIGYQAPVYLNRYKEVLSCYLPIYSEIEKQIAHFIFEEEREAKSYMEDEPFSLPAYVLRNYCPVGTQLDSIKVDLPAGRLNAQTQEF